MVPVMVMGMPPELALVLALGAAGMPLECSKPPSMPPTAPALPVAPPTAPVTAFIALPATAPTPEAGLNFAVSLKSRAPEEDTEPLPVAVPIWGRSA